MTRRTTIAPIRRRRPHGTASDEDLVAVEAPLLLSVRRDPDGRPHRLGLLMRTPGHDADLVAGLLYAEGIVNSGADIVRLEPAAGGEGTTVVLASHVAWSPVAHGDLLPTSACGLCGRLEMLAADPARACPPDGPRLDEAQIDALPDRLRRGQAVFDETGGLHAAALVDLDAPDRSRDLIREDVGRHNAVDKVIGAALVDGRLPARRSALVVSGRVAYEIVQKAVTAGLPAVVAIGAPTSLAVEAARAAGLTLVGFARTGRFNVYAGWHRVTPDRADGGKNSAPFR